MAFSMACLASANLLLSASLSVPAAYPPDVLAELFILYALINLCAHLCLIGFQSPEVCVRPEHNDQGRERYYHHNYIFVFHT